MCCDYLLILACVCVFDQAIERDSKLREQKLCASNPIGTNDFDYEDKQKTQDSIQVYEGLHFNLAAESSKNFFIYLSSIILLYNPSSIM